MNWIDSIMPGQSQNRLSDFLRITLGIFIIYKGASFSLNFQEWLNYIDGLLNVVVYDSGQLLVGNISELQQKSNTLNVTIGIFLATYVTLAHIIGGLLIVLGLYTRWICLIQIPILLGAIFIVNFPTESLTIVASIEFGTSVIVLISLVYFFVVGSGEYSIDKLRRREIKTADYVTQTRIR